MLKMVFGNTLVKMIQLKLFKGGYHGVLVPNVSVLVRDGKQIFFSATNP